MINRAGQVAQLVEHSPEKAGVVGSSPTLSIQATMAAGAGSVPALFRVVLISIGIFHRFALGGASRLW